jgi:flagellar biosynthesis protein FlhB
MPDQDGEKSQDATPHRRQKAREEGQVAKSQDLGSAVLLLVGMLIFLTAGRTASEFVADYSRRLLGGEAWIAADTSFFMSVWNGTVVGLAGVLLPIFGLMLVAAIVVNLAQVGFLFLPNKVQPDITKIDPMKGAKRLFSMQSVARLVFGLFKVMVVACVAYFSLYSEKETILGLSALSVGEVTAYITETLIWTTIKIAVALLILAILDYAFQKWKHEQDLKMTQQEVREEMKNMEGDPQMAARRKQVQRQLAMDRLADAVPNADVVVTNPTELAIAIQYKPDEMDAPLVVAKGAGVLAQRIRRLALENGIPIVEKKPLAQALYREVEVGKPVPHQRYAAVAEVLAYVYQLQGREAPTPKAA